MYRGTYDSHMEGPQKGWRTFELNGFEILVGRAARDNDYLTFKVARPQDTWLHASGYAGSHANRQGRPAPWRL